MQQTECSETSAYKIQTPGNYPEENQQRTEHGESLKSRIKINTNFGQITGIQEKVSSISSTIAAGSSTGLTKPDTVCTVLCS